MICVQEVRLNTHALMYLHLERGIGVSKIMAFTDPYISRIMKLHNFNILMDVKISNDIS